jgi:hypothetical protein
VDWVVDGLAGAVQAFAFKVGTETEKFRKLI